MKRRDFLKSVALATAAGATAPINSYAADNSRQPDTHRDAGGAMIERFSNDCRVRSGMALGGIGAGSIELRKDGRFYNWAILNNFPKETGPEFTLPEGEHEDPMASNLFFKVRYQVEGEEPRIKLLQLCNEMNEGGQEGIAYTFPWMEAVARISYSARFPFARLAFSDDEMPFELLMDTWTPFIPHDIKNSSLPLAYFDFTLTPKTSKKVDVMLMMSARNLTGYDTVDKAWVTEIKEASGYKTISMSASGMNERADTWGQIAISSLAGDSTHYCGWTHQHPYYEYVIRHERLPNLDDTNGVESMKGNVPPWMPPTGGRNDTDPKTGKKTANKESRLFCTIGKSLTVGGSATPLKHTFVYSWNFPNLYAESEFRKRSGINEGHYYSNFFGTAFEVADYAAAQHMSLHNRSRQFLNNFFDSSADVAVLEQINSQLNTFVTSGRLVKSGDFGVLEGLAKTWSWGPIATIDVMLYGTLPVIALFPELQKSTMRCHARLQSEQGEVAHGLFKNFHASEDGTAGVSHRLDLPGQFVIMILRDYFWTEDKEYLRELYPAVKKAMDYIINHRSFAGDQIPIMRGIECSYDNFPMYGYSSYLVSQWLCALASAVQAADVMGDSEAKSRYQAILDTAKRTMEQKLWNGKYYRLYNDVDHSGGKGGLSEGCLTDQMVGQWAANQSALGHLLEKRNIDTALSNILHMSYRPGFGLRNCSWPEAGFLSDVDKDIWADQGNTCWTGVELAFASFLLYEGFYKEAIEVIHTVDRRYRKNGLYWSHQEFGGHYFRPMSAWGIVNGLLGFAINQGKLRFDPQLQQESFKLFFATPTATAHFIKSRESVRIRCLTGLLNFRELEVKGKFKGLATVAEDALSLIEQNGRASDSFTTWRPVRPVALSAGEELVLV